MVHARDLVRPAAALGFLLLASAAGMAAQAPGSQLPATAPTALPGATIEPLAGVANAGTRPGEHRHHAQVTCTGGKLQVQADNSSLNGILRAVSRCTGMKITGGVLDQRVFGSYGPADPGTVLATLLDGTGSNMLLRETAANQPAELILTPRSGGASPPSPSMALDDDRDDAALTPAPQPGTANQPADMYRNVPATAQRASGQTPVPSAARQPGSSLSGPVSIPQPINNVNGSPNNVSPTPGTYPTTDSVPLDSLRTPSTTPPVNGIVDAPNPPAPGSDTAAMFHGEAASTPEPTNVTDAPTSATTQPGATNTTVPAQTPAPGTSPANPGDQTLTPQQVYQQLQQIQQQQQQQQAPTTPSPSSPQ